MIKLTIYGRLRKFVGQSSFEIKAKTPLEAFSFLINNFKGVAQHIKDQEYCVMAGNLKITEDLLNLRTESDIKIIPVVHGEIFNFIIGGALSFLQTGSLSFLGGLKIGSAALSVINTVGLAMVAQGVGELLTPTPKPFNVERQEDPQDPSYSFGGLLNNTKQGVPINIIYGETLVGSTVISSSIDTFQVVNTA
jgi:predicted phage tail protein